MYVFFLLTISYLLNSEFATLLESLVPSASELIITDDFNIHVDQPTSSTASPFLSLLDSFDLTQHVRFPTQSSGHTLDLLITRSSSTIVSSAEPVDPGLSDHHAILSTLCILSVTHPPRISKSIRALRSINIANFSSDIQSSSLFSSPAVSCCTLSCPPS